MPDWISTREAAELIGVSESTVYRSLVDPETADREWGAGNWKVKPFAKRRIFRVARARAVEIADSNGMDHGAPPLDRGHGARDA